MRAIFGDVSGSVVATGWFHDGFAAACRTHKFAEIARVTDMDTEVKCAAYEAAC